MSENTLTDAEVARGNAGQDALDRIVREGWEKLVGKHLEKLAPEVADAIERAVLKDDSRRALLLRLRAAVEEALRTTT